MKSWCKLLGITSLAVLLILLGTALAKAQAIDDWFRLHNYSPQAAIIKIANDDKLTDHARHSFLFVKAVDDQRLSGVEEVTTAHEMLHAAYDRLSSKQRQKVDSMLMDYYNNGLHDQRIIDTMNSYKQTEPNDVVNEMHSVFGTEIADLPAPLENYYKQYFSDRSVVTTFAQNYEDEFTSRIAKIKQDDAELARERSDIQSKEAALQSQLASIEADRNQVEHSNDPSVIDNYNARVSAYNSGVRSLRTKIINYNQLVDDRNALAAELRSLQSSLDNRLSTQPAQ
jgi:DNA repair exonuclease SbcCD ATPase subunit